MTASPICEKKLIATIYRYNRPLLKADGTVVVMVQVVLPRTSDAMQPELRWVKMHLVRHLGTFFGSNTCRSRIETCHGQVFGLRTADVDSLDDVVDVDHMMIDTELQQGAAWQFVV